MQEGEEHQHIWTEKKEELLIIKHYRHESGIIQDTKGKLCFQGWTKQKYT